MVQTHSAKRSGWNLAHYRDHWKIYDRSEDGAKEIKQELSSRNFAFNSSSNLTRLRQLAVRADRNLLSYEKIPVSELRGFVAQRGLMVNAEVPKKRTQLVKFLEQADEQSNFHRFVELPPELRTLVYGFYFGHLKDNARMETPSVYQPPLTTISRLVRKESLPIFEDMSTMKVVMHDHGLHSGAVPEIGLQSLPNRLVQCSPRVIPNLKHFILRGYFGIPGVRLSRCGLQAKLTLPSTGVDYNLEFGGDHDLDYYMFSPEESVFNNKLRDAVKQYVHLLANRGGNMRLSARDVEGFVDVVQAALTN